MKDDTDKPLKDCDIDGVMAALIRASKRAKLLAAYTGTAYITFRDGEVISEIPDLADVLKEQGAHEGWELELRTFAKSVGLNWGEARNEIINHCVDDNIPVRE